MHRLLKKILTGARCHHVVSAQKKICLTQLFIFFELLFKQYPCIEKCPMASVKSMCIDRGIDRGHRRTFSMLDIFMKISHGDDDEKKFDWRTHPSSLLASSSLLKKNSVYRHGHRVDRDAMI